MSKFYDSLAGRIIWSDDDERVDNSVLDPKPNEVVKICKLCGKPFLAVGRNRNKIIYCPRKHYTYCQVCYRTIEITPQMYGSYALTHTCSKECMKIYDARQVKRSFETRYGADVHNPMDIEEYRNKVSEGLFRISASDREKINEKVKQTIKDRYGEDGLKSEEIRRRVTEGCLKSLGVTNPGKSQKCAEKRKQTCKSKYGNEYAVASEEVRAKSRVTNLERYGTIYPMQNQTVRDRVSQTVMEKYGAPFFTQTHEFIERITLNNRQKYGQDWPMQTPEFQLKRQNTCLQKYGVKASFASQEIKEAIRKTCNDKYGVDYPLQNEEIQAKAHETQAQNGTHHISEINRNFAKQINQLGISTKFEKSLNGKFYDIELLEHNIVIEINPSYTHNVIGGNLWGSKVDKNYHKVKTDIARNNNYRCIHVWDWDDKLKILNSLYDKTNIYARKCDIRYIDDKTCDDFLNSYHFQNTCRGQKIKLGLFYNDELLQVMTFGKPRYNTNYEYELLRLCTKPKYSIVGGANKLFKHFCKNYKPKSIISYCDLSKFTGKVYSDLGFTKKYETSPTMVWSKGVQKITNNLLLQRGYDQLFNTNYGKGTSNEALMIENGWLPVYDCGQGVYTLNFD